MRDVFRGWREHSQFVAYAKNCECHPLNTSLMYTCTSRCTHIHNRIKTKQTHCDSLSRSICSPRGAKHRLRFELLTWQPHIKLGASNSTCFFTTFTISLMNTHEIILLTIPQKMHFCQNLQPLLHHGVDLTPNPPRFCIPRRYSSR